MKKAMLAMILLAGSAFAGPRVAVGINFGVPAPVGFVRPACPGPGDVWVDGYYAPNGVWVAGYWNLPVGPVGYGPRYVAPAPRFVPGGHFAYGHDFHRGFRR